MTAPTSCVETPERFAFCLSARAMPGAPRCAIIGLDARGIADARGDPGASANDYSIAWSARGNLRGPKGSRPQIIDPR
jgi:hypothetical protein